MSTLKDRIKAARKHAGLTQRELAVNVGVSQPVISQLESGENLQSVHLLRIAGACGVRPQWLADGEGAMVDAGQVSESGAGQYMTSPAATSGAADKVLAMLSRHKGLSATARDQIAQAVEQTVAEAVHGSNVISADFSGSRVKPGEILIPQYDVRGSMGHGQVPADYTDFMRNVVVSVPQLEKLGLDYTSAANLAIISGWGQSMAPTIQDKDPVIVDRGVNDFIGDGVYVITWDGMLYIKRLQKVDAERIELISDNPKHKDRVVSLDEVAIHARVLLVWNASKL
ncbi:XRE family transcriptional regulator [Pseudomonas sp. ML96]|uniref:XRE family transcriptional regulator n=1 Tax=Pseudomonas sp. ML96 TaxID=1523503 RepID=UPI0005B9666A|nr:S24 family peptidase [Pseudomonas sp. ML96]